MCASERWRLPSAACCVVLIVGAGCASNSSKSTSPPAAGLKPATQRATLTSEQYNQIYVANVAFAEWYLARLASACDELAQGAETPDARYEALRLKAAQGTSVYSILTSPNAVVQVLSLRTLTELTHLKWVNEGKALALFGDRGGKLLIDALDDMQRRGRSHALGVLTDGEIDAIAESASRWRSENRAISDIEFIRFDEFATEMAQSLAKRGQGGLMTAMQNAAEGLAETQLLSMRALVFASRLPRIIQWQLEAQVADIARRPEIRTQLDSVTRITQAAEALAKESARVQDALNSLPKKLTDSIAAEPTIRDAIAAGDKAAASMEASSKQLAGVEASLRQLDGTVGKLNQQFDQLSKAYDPPSIERMVQDGKLAATREVRSLIYLGAGALAALVVLQALMRRWSSHGTSSHASARSRSDSSAPR